eukprot:TRINITY_DN12320_c1_g1_i1.p2 TRINITY_DN12320_c1_g1~~TRINITY_DN12320_c1_g1_i1.p2  ORF type:complete len:236 (+),score=64.42 TRINITY_DN12320_c1_g1_i1:141-848(+)
MPRLPAGRADGSPGRLPQRGGNGGFRPLTASHLSVLAKWKGPTPRSPRPPQQQQGGAANSPRDDLGGPSSGALVVREQDQLSVNDVSFSVAQQLLFQAGAAGLLSEGDAVVYRGADTEEPVPATVVHIDRSTSPPQYLLRCADGSELQAEAAQVTPRSADGDSTFAFGLGAADPADKVMMGIGGAATALSVAGAIGGFTIAIFAAPVLAAGCAVSMGLQAADITSVFDSPSSRRR